MRLHNFRNATLLLSICFLLVSPLAWGQARTEGELSGTVVDPSGAGIPNATVTLQEPGTGFNRSIKSNASGAYVFPDLQPGTYTLTASEKGFAPATYQGAVVYAGRTTNLKVTLKVGAVAATVSVSAQNEVLETSSNTLANTVTGSSIQNLPLNGRDALPFAQLLPGAQVGGDQRFTTYNAMPNAAINISVDGTNNNFQRYRTSTTGFFTASGLRIGAVDEMTVSTDQLSADAAAEGAATINVTIKHGTNSFHGNAFWETYNSALDANTYGNNLFLYASKLLATADPTTSAAYAATGRKLPYHINDYGGSLGGPILKNKLFFFFNFEDESTPGSSLVTTPVLSQSAQQGLFTYTRADNGQHETVSLYNIAAAKGFPFMENSNIASMLSTVNGFTSAGQLAPNTISPLLATLQNNLTFTYNNSTQQIWPTVRVDFLPKPNVTWHTSYNLYWRHIPKTPIYPRDPILLNGFQSSYSTFSTGLDWTINSNLVNQANFGILNNQEEFQPGNSFNAFEGITYLPIPTIFASPATSTFTPPIPDCPTAPGCPGGILPEPRNNPVWNATDNVTWTHGNHTITFGASLRFSNAHDVSTQPPIAQNLGISNVDPAAGMFNAGPVAGCSSDTQGCFPGGLGTANNNEAIVDAQALYSLLTGRVASILGLVPLDTTSKQYTPGAITTLKEEQKVGGVYVQDAWKVRPQLALNFGLRWQFTGPITNTNNYFTSPTFPNLLGPSTALFQPGQLNGISNPQISLNPQPYGGYYKQPAPRFGFAWNPTFQQGILGRLLGNGTTVVRGGYAINWYDEGWLPWENVATGPLSNESFFLNSGQFPAGSLSFNPTTPAVSSINSFPNTGGKFVTPLPAAEFTFTGIGALSGVDPNLRPPYIQNWSFGIQRQIPGNWVIEVNYVGNHAVHMWMAYDLNEVNIFQNAPGFTSFLQDFKNAQLNLTASGGATFQGPNPTPILSQAYSGQPLSTTFQNPSNTFLVQTGQAGALAGAITQNPTFLCNLFGSAFSPCVSQGLLAPGQGPASPAPGIPGLAYPANFFQINPYSSVGSTSTGGGAPLTLLSDPGSATYNGLHVNVKHPVGHGLNFMANYAYSHALTNRYLGDYFSADSALVDFYTLRNPGLNRVPSPYDLRHTFNALFTYELPFGTGKAFNAHNSVVDKVIGGWTVGSIVTWQIGRNFKLAGGQDTFNWFDNSGVFNSSGAPPDAQDSGVVLNGISVSQLQGLVGVHPGPTTVDNGVTVPVPSVQALALPTSLFGPGGAVQPESTPGQFGQIVFLHGPMFVNTDISLTKSLAIWERLAFDLHVEFVNAFNHPNFNYTDGYSAGSNNPAQYLFVNIAPYSPLTGPSPASVGGQLAPRQIQFRLELTF